MRLGPVSKEIQSVLKTTAARTPHSAAANTIPRQHSQASRTRSGVVDFTWSSQSAASLTGRWRVPEELWGAANAVAAACRKNFSSHTRPPLAPQASATASAGGQQARTPEGLAALLDFEATVSPTQAAISLAVSTVVCVGIYAMTAPTRFSPVYSLSMAFLFAISIAVTRIWLVEHQWEARLVSETSLGDPDSHFSVIDGERPQQSSAASTSTGANSIKHVIHCYHGFGANTFSWSFVEQKLAEDCQARVTSHDMPGFGLTERSSNRDAYTLEFNGRLGRHLMDSAVSVGNDNKFSGDLQGAGNVKRVLIGHSMGAACAAAEAAEHPEGLDALILVAPAIIGRNKKRKLSKEEEFPEKLQAAAAASSPTLDATSPSDDSTKPLTDASSDSIHRRGPLGTLKAVGRVIIAIFQALLARLLEVLVRLARPIFALALRQLVRRRGFWEKGLRSGWVRKEGVTPEVVNGYRRPQLVRGWEAGMLEFLAARTRSRRDIGHSVREAWRGMSDPGPAERLANSLEKHRDIKVLVIHGKQDYLVPLSNSRRLVQMLPNAELLEFDACGHLPQEELPGQFLQAVQTFLKK
ncbi:hypothetical protein WJX84_008523 [Apatococcus fuscideae]|uniref:AB hydrolase-1 domain-containing protein n=1 Tax=Apatococcus fuscideae TaxID=2026836 RepID=A0AAW1SYA7_9CHLO